MKARKQWRPWGMALTVALCLAAPLASAQVVQVFDEGGMQNALLDDSVSEIEIVAPSGPASINASVPFPVTRDLTIRGQLSKQPYEIRVSGGGGAVFEVQGNVEVTFENLTFIGGGVQVDGATVRFNRVWFEAGDAAIETLDTMDDNPTIVIAANCLFNLNSVGIQLGDSNHKAYVLQSTFRGAGNAVAIVSDVNLTGATLGACLFESPSFAVAQPGGIVTLEGCYPEVATGFPITENAPVPFVSGTPEFESAAPWPGKLVPTGAIYSTLSFSDLEPELQSFTGEFNNTDFEGQGRSQSSLQVGADEVGGTVLPPQWLDVDVSVDPVGKDRETEITVTTAFNLTAGDKILIVPESVTNLGPFDISTADPASYDVLDIPFDTTAPEVTGVTVAYTPTSTYIGDNVLLDGRATIMILTENGTLYNPNDASASNVAPGLAADASFVIDTVAPVFVGSNGFANELVTAANESSTALDVASGVPPVFPFNWIPAAVAWPTNDAAVGDGSGRTPVILLNTPRTDDLALTITTRFEDVQVTDRDGLGIPPVETSGFSPLSGVGAATGDAIEDELFEIPDELSEFSNGYWEGVIPGGFPATASLSKTSAINTGVVYGEDELEINWALGGLPYEDGWNMGIRIFVLDAAGNGSEEGIPLSVWWIDNTRGEITSGPSGSATSDPSFTWKVRHDGASPGDVAPLVPAASFRLWRADAPGSNPLWTPLGNWAPYTSSATVGRNAVLIPGTPPVRLGEVLDQDALQGELLMLTVVGADESGNVQPWFLADGPVTYADLIADQVTFSTWQNGESSLSDATRLDTSISATFWHNRVDDAAGIRSVQQVEQSFGDSRRIPLPAEEDCFDRVEGRFDVQLDFPDDLDPTFVQFAQWELFEDGRLVAIGFLRNPDNIDQTQFTLQLPEDILNPDRNVLALMPPVVPIDPIDFLNAAPVDCNATKDRLGDEGDSAAGVNGAPNRLRDVTYVLSISAGYGDGFPTEPCLDCIFDPTPASIEFTVAVERDARNKDNPVLVNQKL